jgi:hypothetical protein
MKKYLIITLLGFYSSTGFSQIYGVGNGSGQAINCINWDLGLVILPLHLVSFDASCSEGKTILQWSTPAGLNAGDFGIERSGDGLNFQPLGNNYTKTTRNSNYYFRFTDATTPEGRSYYRLTQTNTNNQVEYSQVISADCNTGNNLVISIYPNPASGLVNIKTGTAKTMLTVWNLMGQSILQIQAKHPVTTINLEHFPPGVYYIEIHSPGKSTYHKVVLSRN